MRRALVSWCAVGCLLSLAVTTNALAGKYNEVVNIGDQAPVFRNLIGTDDKSHSLADLKQAKAVVVVFTCNHCPVAVAYEKRLVQLTKDYKDKGVAVVAINVNNLPADRLDKMKERAEERGFNFPYLYDPSQKTGKAYGAAVTPHCFVLDGRRHIAYMGAIDDNMRQAKAKQHYVRDALDAILAGSKPKVTESKQFGCSIKYDS